MEQKIVDYILQKYNPVGLVLHGSRATGRAVADSDWDFIIFTREKKNLHREVLFGESVELLEEIVPVAEHSLLNKFCPKLALDRCKIIHDPEGVVRRVAEACQKDVDSGMTMEDWEYGVQKQILSGLLGKIKRYTDEPAGALQYAGQFIEKALQWWFYNINKTRSLPAYQSLPYIKEKDPDYYLLLQEFSTFEIATMQSAGQKIINYICNHE